MPIAHETRIASPEASAVGVLPRWLQERIAAAFRADRVIADRDETQRMAYESRVRPPVG